MVLGDENKAPTAADLDRMRALVREAMEQGAVGVSTSLQYPPAPYASTEELIALAAEAASYGGIYATHMRNEGEGILTALDEAVRIGREAHIPVEIWHLKTAGKPSWGRMSEVVAKIDEARRSGLDITADTYAYTAWYNSFSAFVPPWAHDGGAKKLVERLRDPAVRERLRKEMETPSTAWNITWDNEWQEIPGPEAVILCTVQNPALRPLVRQDPGGDRETARQGPDRYPFRHPGGRRRLHLRGRFRHVRARRRARPRSSPGSRSTTIRKARRPRVFWARGIRIRGPTAPFRASSANTSAKRRS